MKRILLTSILLASLIGNAFAADVIIKADDAVQQKIDASSPGDVLKFDAMSVTNIQGKGDRTYQFTKLSGGSGGVPAMVWRNQKNITITPGSVVDNGNLSFETCSFVKIRNVTFSELRGRSGNGAHVIYSNRLTDSDISNNNFVNQIGLGVDTCIFAFDPVRTKFNGNHFYPKVHEAIHIMWYGNYWDDSWPAGTAVRTDVETCFNEIVGIERHGIESQGGPYGYKCEWNHVSKRGHDGINVSGATGGHFGDGRYIYTKDISYSFNVCDNTPFSPSNWSQCMGVEFMGRGVCNGNWIVNSGQGIAYTANAPETQIKNNKFKNQGGHEIVTDPPHENAITPKPENFTGNDFNYTGTIPTYVQLMAMAGQIQPPPATQPTPAPSLFTLIANSTTATTVTFSLAGLPAGVTSVRIKAISSDGHEVAPDRTLDGTFTAGPYNTNWKYDFTAEALGVGGIVIGKSNTLLSVQVKAPTTQPAPPPPPPAPSETIIKGLPWDLVFPVAPDGKVGQPTTRKAA